MEKGEAQTLGIIYNVHLSPHSALPTGTLNINNKTIKLMALAIYSIRNSISLLQTESE
jgi:hypothetical protein